ncbi:hypothetical protein [Paenibacillus sp. JJ-223]|uniref:hypothetical protein n=1 Tax=Paenibacillus sp. JJ-223 TaxID=2905647 RepID=UPI001F2C0EFF|nr:hypothetical protein [Paenibacillus sp. JJ-223]CAH1226222.1 hypothetical protein PAECIP111890_05911 [Paenibacillus sp. JJ-223]
MKSILSVFILVLMVTGCSGKGDYSNHSTAPQDALKTSEAIILAQQESKGQKKILLALDTKNPELQSNLKEITGQAVQEILKTNKYNLEWLDLKNISPGKGDFNALKIGAKIKFVADKEHLDTVPPTSIAKEIKIEE